MAMLLQPKRFRAVLSATCPACFSPALRPRIIGDRFGAFTENWDRSQVLIFQLVPLGSIGINSCSFPRKAVCHECRAMSALMAFHCEMMLTRALVIAAIRGAQVTLFFFVGCLLETLFESLHETHSVTRKSASFNLLYSAFYIFPDLITGSVIAFYLSSILSRRRWKTPVSFSFRDHHIFALALLIAFCWMLLRDLFQYWVHRLEHSKWFWPIHALHHSDESMNVTTTNRHHWLAGPLQALLITVPFSLLVRAPVVSFPIAFVLVESVHSFIAFTIRDCLSTPTRILPPSFHSGIDFSELTITLLKMNTRELELHPKFSAAICTTE